MSTSQITSHTTSPSHQFNVEHCTRCGMVLPPVATFCRQCGERVEKPAQYTKALAVIDEHADLGQYRITSLLQRIPYAQISLAMDTQQQRPVAIRDINIQQIDIANHPHIFRALQQEYDLLRRHTSDAVLPLFASFYAQNHLYSISAWPLPTRLHKSKYGQAPSIYTLQDVLQSGIGLPDEQIALYWILRLAKAVKHLHKINIVIGTLDPSTILLSQKDYSGQPTLFPSWMLPAVQAQMQQVLNIANTPHISHFTTDRTAFFSPEAKQGRPEIRSDVYSMGAILYLLVTGIAPAEQSITSSQQLRSPRKINPRVHNTLATIILKALAREPSARFQSVDAFVAALWQQQEQSKASQSLYNVLFGQNRFAEKARTDLAEINFTFAKDSNKTEQSQAAQADLKTSDDTIRISPKQVARYYLSQINTQKLGQDQINPDNEESMPKSSFLEPKKQIEEKKAQQTPSNNPATVAEVASGPEGGASLQNKPDNTASPSQDEQNTDDQQVSSQTAMEEAPKTQITVADAESIPDDSTTSLDAEPIPDDSIPIPLETHAEPIPDDSIPIPLETHAEPISDDSTPIPLDTEPITDDSSTAIFLDAEQVPLTEPSQQNDSATEAPTDSKNTSPSPAEVLQQDQKDRAKRPQTSSSLLERIKRFVIGGQPHINNAVAMIETPMRIQPNTNYTIRIHIMGRNEPKRVSGFKQSNGNAGLGGLGSLVHGDLVHIEVRSALYHNYAYIVQQTDVEVPAHNYAAEVTIPMRSLTDHSGTRRERLHIFFTDKKHSPLYEQPFLIELFISNLVQSGHEGHNVLSIPL